MWLRSAINKGVDGWAEGDLKTHQQRRVALDPEIVQALTEHLDRCRARAEALGLKLSPNAFVFSGAPDGSTYLTPGALTQRYNRLAERLEIETSLHKLRHYSATEFHGERGRTHRGRAAGAFRRRYDHAQDLHRRGVRSRPACGQRHCDQDAKPNRALDSFRVRRK